MDNGFIALSFRFSSNRGKQLENLILSELIKAGYEVWYYNKNFECDFIAQKDGKRVAIQVCYELNDSNKKREFNGLLKLPFEVDEKLIITYNQEYVNEGIVVTSFWRYF